jgi:hypothetical protein
MRCVSSFVVVVGGGVVGGAGLSSNRVYQRLPRFVEEAAERLLGAE